MNDHYSRYARPGLALLRVLMVIAMLISPFTPLIVAQPALAVGGSYNLNWTAAEPAVNKGSYLPTYMKVSPTSLACPTPSGSVGRAADPLAHAVFGNPKDSVESLAPQDMALGQIVPFEVKISVSGSTAPENGVIQFTPYWLTKTTSGNDFGYDPAYEVYCAFVDAADAAAIDPGANAKVDSWTDTVADTGTSNEQIQGTFQVSGLDDGDSIIVEIWVVLKSTIPAKASGNVQTGLLSAKTASGDTINTGNQTVPLLQVGDFFKADADVSVTKSDGPDPVRQGEQLSYQIEVKNNSTSVVANGVVATDTLDPNTTFVSASGASCSASGQTVTCNVGALIPLQLVTINLVVKVSATAPTAGTLQTGKCTVGQTGVDLCNLVSVTAITSDPNTANNNAWQPTDVLPAIVPAPKLGLVKSASPATYGAVGNTVTYNYVLTNIGNVALSAPYAVTDNKVTVTCLQTPSPLPVGSSITCNASYAVTQVDLDAGSITNKAKATATYGGNSVTSNEATATVNALQAPALKLTKNASPSTYDAAGQKISYSYEVKNTGNVTLSGPFTVSDDKATDETCPTTASLAPGASITCNASYAVTQADLDASSVTNKATATNGTITSNEATATVYATAKPNLSLVKSASPATYGAVGNTVTYNYVLTNIGNVALSAPYAVTDNKVTVTCLQTPSPLPVGSSITCNASYAVTQVDLDAGSITNKAKATATYGGNSVTSNEATATVNALQAPALVIDKVAQDATYAKVGDELHYSYLVTNSGNVTLHDAIVVTDDKAAVSCPALPAEGFAPKASITCSAVYVVTQADLDASSVTNSAYATSGTTTSPTDKATVPATQTPGFTLTKSPDPTTYSAVGQLINYTYIIANTGNVTLSGPFTVSDDKAQVTCPNDESLAPGLSLTCHASYVVTQADLDSGSVTNKATAQAYFNDKPGTSNEATATVKAVQAPALKLTKNASPSTYDAAGQKISYSYVLENTGNVTLSGPFTVNDDKAMDESCPATASLAPKDFITCNSSYAVTQADMDNGSVTNIATATASFGGNTVTSNQGQATVNAVQQGGLGLTKSADRPTYGSVGDVVSYSYVLENTGNVTLSGPFTVNDDKTGAVACPTGSLAPGASVTCNASYAVTQADLDNGSVTNKAKATDGTLTSNEATATVNAVQAPALVIDKVAQDATYAKVGDELHYSYLVTNSGNVTLHDAIVVTDDKAAVSCPALPAEGFAPKASITCSAVYVVTQADLDAGSVTNSAYATSGTTTSPTDKATVPATQTPGFTLTKSPDPTTYSAVGQLINYTYIIANTGNVTLSGPFTVSDDKAQVTCPNDESLAPGLSLTCHASYVVTQADLDSGSVTNKATAQAYFNDKPGTSNEATATVKAVQAPALKLTKNASPSTYDAAGQKISYSYVLENTGNVTLSGPFTVNDDKAMDESCPATASLAPKDFITCNSSYAVTQADMDNGSVTNIATATASFGGNTVTSNQGQATVNAVPKPDLSLVKSADPSIYDAAGQTISYSYVAEEHWQRHAGRAVHCER